MRNIMSDITAFAEAGPTARAECIFNIKNERKKMGRLGFFLAFVNFLIMIICDFKAEMYLMPLVLNIVILMCYSSVITQQMTYESFDIVLKKLEALTARPDTEGATLAAETPAPEGSGQE